MAEIIEAKGSCLCKSVKIASNSVSRRVGACHCSICRNWGGGPLLAIDCGTDVRFDGEENISVYSSSDWAERGFCRSCGTHLFYKLTISGQYIVPVGLFGELSDLVFDHQVFVDEQPNYYCFANKTKNMTGEEVFAAYVNDN